MYQLNSAQFVGTILLKGENEKETLRWFLTSRSDNYDLLKFELRLNFYFIFECYVTMKLIC